MWFVFPQIAGLGFSQMTRHYAITNLGEACAYLAHPILGARLAECTDLMLEWSGRRGAEEILGPIDARKFASSMTMENVNTKASTADDRREPEMPV